MKKVIHLDSHDITDIIAKHFGVATDSVNVCVKQEYEGQGPLEHKVSVVAATVEEPI